jgi:hypothetical protein
MLASPTSPLRIRTPAHGGGGAHRETPLGAGEDARMSSPAASHKRPAEEDGAPRASRPLKKSLSLARQRQVPVPPGRMPQPDNQEPQTMNKGLIGLLLLYRFSFSDAMTKHDSVGEARD